ncbi:MAG: hypothetical protein ACT4OU_04725 [Hyphomicrobium sp.]
MAQNDIVGYTIAYEQEEIQFPVYVLAALAACLIGAAAYHQSLILLSLGFIAACAALYNYPLLETGRPRIGSGQYGVFIESLGLVQWRSIDRIDIVDDVVRGVASEELEIGLKTPIGEALIIDWRKRPFWRSAMRVVWKMPNPQLIRITLGVLDRPPQEIHQTFLRMWRYHRGVAGPPIEGDDQRDDEGETAA